MHGHERPLVGVVQGVQGGVVGRQAPDLLPALCEVGVPELQQQLGIRPVLVLGRTVPRWFGQLFLEKHQETVHRAGCWQFRTKTGSARSNRVDCA